MLHLTPLIHTRDLAVAHLAANLSLEIEGKDSLQSCLIARLQAEIVDAFAVTRGALNEALVTSYTASKRWSQPAAGDDESQVQMDLQLLLQWYFLTNPANSVILHPTVVAIRKQHHTFTAPFYAYRGTNVMCVVDQAFNADALDEAITDCDQAADDRFCFSFVRAPREHVHNMPVNEIAAHVHLVATQAFDREGFVFVRFARPLLDSATER